MDRTRVREGQVRADMQNHIYSYLPSPSLYAARHLVCVCMLIGRGWRCFFVPGDKDFVLFFDEKDYRGKWDD